MEINMHQQPFKWKLSYKFIESNDTIRAKADKGRLPTKRNVVLYENEQIVIQAIESNLKKIWLRYIPFVNSFIHEEFDVHMDQSVGKLKNIPVWKQPRIELAIKNSHYVVYQHTRGTKGDAYSVYQDEEQIGVVYKNKEIKWGAQTYNGLFHDDTNTSINRFLIVFIDVFLNDDTEIMNETYARSKEVYSWGWDRKFGRPLNENWKVNERTSKVLV